MKRFIGDASDRQLIYLSFRTSNQKNLDFMYIQAEEESEYNKAEQEDQQIHEQ